MRLECRLFRRKNETVWKIQDVDNINGFWLALEVVISVPSKLVMESQGKLAGWLTCEGMIHLRAGDIVHESVSIVPV